MKYLVIINCTSRKAAKPSQVLARPPKITKGSQLTTVARDWVKKIDLEKNLYLAKDLYQGRTIIDTKASVQILNKSDVYVVSAGMGLTHFDTSIPSYELTVVENSQFQKNLEKNNFCIQKWWSVLNKARHGTTTPLCALVSKKTYSKIFIVMPSSYLDLIRDDLWKADPKKLKNTLIFTSPYGQTKIPSEWGHHCLAYDDRLEDKKSGYNGTRSDFSQRAFRHFIEHLGLQDSSIEIAQRRVLACMGRLQIPALPERRKVQDEEIIRQIKKNWKKNSGHAHKLLRHLRDDLLISCEQSRFQRLWNEIRIEISPKLL